MDEATNVNPAPTAAEVIAAAPAPVAAPVAADPPQQAPAPVAADPPQPAVNLDAKPPAAPAAPANGLTYHELSADMKAATDHGRHFFTKLEEVFGRVEREGVDDCKAALKWAKAKFEAITHRNEA